jgi:hypothetical protein
MSLTAEKGMYRYTDGCKGSCTWMAVMWEQEDDATTGPE